MQTHLATAAVFALLLASALPADAAFDHKIVNGGNCRAHGTTPAERLQVRSIGITNISDTHAYIICPLDLDYERTAFSADAELTLDISLIKQGDPALASCTLHTGYDTATGNGKTTHYESTNIGGELLAQMVIVAPYGIGGAKQSLVCRLPAGATLTYFRLYEPVATDSPD